MTPVAKASAPVAPSLRLDDAHISPSLQRPSSVWERRLKYVSFPLGLSWFGVLYLAPVMPGLTIAGQSALAIFGLALVWWIGEPVPPYVTSLVLMLLLVLTDTWAEDRVLSVLGLDVIWLNVLAFILGAILIKTHLARRLALTLLARFGRSAYATLGALLVLQLALAPLIPATAARAAMTLPLMLVVAGIYQATAERRTAFGRNLFLQNLLGINVFSSGFMTGSTANLMAVGFILTMGGHRVYYTDWMVANLPVAITAMAVAWVIGPRLLFPLQPVDRTPHIEGGLETVRTELTALGPLSRDERKGLAIFLIVVGLWVTDRFHVAWFGFNIDAVMAAMIGVVIALAPRIGLLKWEDTDIPWHLMIFSAGAYAGGMALDQTGAARWGVQRAFEALHLGRDMSFWTVYSVVIVLNMYSHLLFTSKTMRTVIMIPAVIGIAQYLGYPAVALALPAAFTIDWVISLPISAKPNLILFSTGQYSVLDNLKYGLTMTTIGAALLILAGLTWFRVLGITP
jgi:anion transporter